MIELPLTNATLDPPNVHVYEASPNLDQNPNSGEFTV
jgi:hypothetical protein